MRYKYLARDKYGIKREGEIDAENISSAEDWLRKQGFVDIKLSEKSTKSEAQKKKKDLALFKKKVKEQDLAIFTRQLGAMIGAGISIAQALEILSEQLPNPTLKDSIAAVKDDVITGMSISKAMAKHPKVFPPFLVNLIAAAEESGKLDETLKRATIYYEKIAAIKGKIKSASWYPTAVLVIATIIVLGLLTFVVPTFAQIYNSFGGELPFLTQLLIDISNNLKENILFILGFLIIFFLINRIFYKTYQGKKFYHNLFLKIPLIGKILHKGALAKFARTFATLISGGVPIIRAVEIASSTVGNTLIEESLEKTKNDIEKGKPINQSLDKKYFPPMFIAMAAVGENTGRLDEMLDTIANFYEDEVDREVDALISTLEPMLMVVIGGIVGFILIALYLPIFKLGELIK
ncbi:type II secretion system F family protein [Sulfurihydrogenibium subterraneum]|uniref:type II secretion system F family protein n=1 Tax=Sulfurihydrogenibium subterraneum TaxID=171121 RepID=UPI000AFA24DF|nr:type II secretion system F family protein [Sulfurihydrogenibium subterraneum]